MSVDQSNLEKVSTQASKQIGKNWIYRFSRGKQFKYPYFVPDNPKATSTQINRSVFNTAVRRWQDLTQSQKNVYNEIVRQKGFQFSGYNYYIRLILKEGIELALKKVVQIHQVLAEGVHDIPISQIDVDRSFLHWTSNYIGSAVTIAQTWGIRDAYILNSTTVRVDVVDTLQLGNVPFSATVIEFV